MAGPLDGLSVVVTRAQEQASALSARLAELGAVPVEVATLRIEKPSDDGAALAAAVRELAHYAQVVVASPNGARVLVAAAAAVDVNSLPPVACVGPSTAEVFTNTRWPVNVVPDRYVAEGLLEVIGAPAGSSNRLLLVQAEVSRPVLEVGLGALGWDVDRVAGYQSVDAAISDDDRARAASADIATFTSSSTVERFVRLVGRDALPPVIAAIGPITSATARELGLDVAVEAEPHTLQGLVDGLAAWALAQRDG